MLSRPARDFALAAAVFAGLTLWNHRALLPGGKVNAHTALPPAEERIKSLYEMIYQELPNHWVQARLVKDGRFPSWTPYSEGGTPLIGKMRTGVFSPFHLHYYLLPERLMAYAFTIGPLLAAFALVFLFARLVGLAAIPAAGAAGLYMFSMHFGPDLYSDAASAVPLPLLLALAELSLRGRARLAAFLLPWAAAMPFFTGHFETAARMNGVACLYFLARWWMLPGRKFASLAYFGVPIGLGAALAAVQILPGVEYVSWSYNNVWRRLPEFGWRFWSLQKMLTTGDVPLLVLGWTGLGAAAWGFRQAQNESAKDAGRGLFAVAAGLALGLAALTCVGFDATFYYTRQLFGISPVDEALTVLLCLLALWSCRRGAAPTERTLGIVLLLGWATHLKLPPLGMLYHHFPPTTNFNNSIYTQEFFLARAVLAAGAAWSLSEFARLSWNERRLGVIRLALLSAAIGGGLFGARALTQPLAGALATGIDKGAMTEGAGFMGPEKANTFPGRKTLNACFPSSWPLEAVAIVTVQGGQARGHPAEPVHFSGRRCYQATIDIDKGLDQPVAARVRLVGGKEGMIKGPTFAYQESPKPAAVAAGFALLPLCALHPLAAPAAFLGGIAWLAHERSVKAIKAEDFPFRLPGMDALKKDPALFRLDAFSNSFLQADYAALYGHSDLRNGGDNLDVLPMIYFLFLRAGLIAKPDGSPEQNMGLKMIGLANAKYLLDAPESKHTGPFIEEAYRGKDMAIYRNKLARERVSFFEKYQVLPKTDLRNWHDGRRLAFGAVPQLLAAKDFSVDTTLLLDEEPGAPVPAAGPATAKNPTTKIVSYEPDRVVVSVDAPRPGLVMLADNQFPGWTARVNGSAAKISRGWFTFRAVPVSAGSSTIEFLYRPRSIGLGLAASASAALLWWLGYLLFLWKRPGRADPVLPPTEPVKKPRKAVPSAVVAPENPDLDWLTSAVERAALVIVAPCCLFWLTWALFLRR